MQLYIKPEGSELQKVNIRQVLNLVPFDELFVVDESTADFTIEWGNTIELNHVEVDIDEEEIADEICHALRQYAIMNAK